MTALGGPAALIAGAVVATVYDVNSSGSMATLASDPTWVRWAKKWNQILLATAFAMEVICIFVVTVTGTMLSSYADRPTDYSKPSLVVAKSALGFLKETYEFEYLTSRIAFLQGLLNWLAAIALEHAIPTGVSGGGPSQRAMDVFIASCLGTLILLMLSFYNSHMTFYPNYLSMLGRYAVVLWERYFHRWPPRPLSLLSGPAVLFTLYLGYKAIIAPVDIQDYDSSSSS